MNKKDTTNTNIQNNDIENSNIGNKHMNSTDISNTHRSNNSIGNNQINNDNIGSISVDNDDIGNNDSSNISIGDTDINEILGKQFSNEQISANEQKMLNLWIDENPEEYERLHEIFSSENRCVEQPHFDVDMAWRRVSSQIQNRNKKPKTMRVLYRAISAAAIIILSITAGILYLNDRNKIITVTADANSVKTVILPDKSIVTLNRNTQIQYKKRFASQRNITLSGEAFFEVTADKDHPFSIETSLATVKVLGTSFNVKAYGDQRASVNVERGHVAVISGNQRVELLKDEGAEIDCNGIVKNETSNSNYLWWKERRLVFNNTPFGEVITMLEQYYNVQIILNADLSAAKITTTFTTETASEAMEELKLLLHFDYTYHNNTFTINPTTNN